MVNMVVDHWGFIMLGIITERKNQKRANTLPQVIIKNRRIKMFQQGPCFFRGFFFFERSCFFLAGECCPTEKIHIDPPCPFLCIQRGVCWGFSLIG